MVHAIAGALWVITILMAAGTGYCHKADERGGVIVGFCIVVALAVAAFTLQVVA